MRFRHVHVSGKWDAPMGAFHRMVTEAQGRASVITWTEMTDNAKVHHLHHLPGWDAAAWKPNAKGECAVCWDADVWHRVRARSVAITRHQFRTGKGTLRPPVNVAVVTLRHRKSGEPVTFIAAHLPASVEGKPRRLSGPARRVLAYNDSLGGLRRLVKAERRTHRGVPVVVAADWNLNHKRAWVRALLRARVGGRLTWTGPWRKHPGSHGSRLIDAARLYGKRLRVKHVRLLPKVGGFDHRPFAQVLTLKPRRRKQRGN